MKTFLIVTATVVVTAAVLVCGASIMAVRQYNAQFYTPSAPDAPANPVIDRAKAHQNACLKDRMMRLDDSLQNITIDIDSRLSETDCIVRSSPGECTLTAQQLHTFQDECRHEPMPAPAPDVKIESKKP